ncbi:carbohydrate kinase family protein [Kribbella deserti]|uniref:Carbohydrate kinase family protein n=1 Tax=Kribbella deserti TaxID=1926257 RepID=A0ABV6QLT4_9ACTN
MSAQRESLSPPGQVVVIGGANVDLKVRGLAAIQLHTSNPGRSTTTPGGVGRNIAENLARLGTATYLIAAIGGDAAGERLLAETEAAGVQVSQVCRSEYPTGTYTAVLDADGSLVVAVSDMTATDRLSPSDVDDALIAGASLVILDGNLPGPVLDHALDVARDAGVPVVVEPVSAPKAALLGGLFSAERPVFAVTPNLEELQAIIGRPVAGSRDDLVRAAEVLHARGVEHVWIRLGERGSLLSTAGAGHVLPAMAPAEVRDVTGAGDAMLAAFAHALLLGADPVEAARYGHAAAALTVASTATVRPDLTQELIEDLLNNSNRSQL